MATQLPIPDTTLFKLTVDEIWETDPNMSAFQILDMLIDGELHDWCERYYFWSDDGKIDEQEQFLLDWMPTVKGNEQLRLKCIPLAQNFGGRK